MKPTLTPYLIFHGTAKAAMTFYQSILGGQLTMSTYAESGVPSAEEDKNKIIHADLKNDTLSFMASDDNAKKAVVMGSNVHISIAGTDEKTITEYFNKLSEGGTVDTPLAKQMWGDIFGMLTDKFGVHWMVNIGSEQK